MKDSAPFSEALASIDLMLSDVPWPFAQNERKKIDQHWQELVQTNPALWNGDVLIGHSVYLGSGRLSARFTLTDFASLMAWRDWGFPDKLAFNVFGMAALTTSDEVLVFAEMSDHTMNAAKIFPPGGSLEMRDVVEGGIVDIEGSMFREMKEETGFDLALARPGPRFAVMDEQRIAVLQRFTCAETFADLQRVFAVHEDSNRELKRLVPIKSRAAICDAIPAYAQEIVRQVFPT